MPIEHIHTYLVHPGKGSSSPSRIGGTSVKLSGKLFKLLSGIYSNSDSECDTDISFSPSLSGDQINPCRDLIINYMSGPTIDLGRRIAERLEKVTTNRSGLGLLFLIFGRENLKYKIVISRFQADNAILAEENREDLSVKFLERVFMKSARAYKAVAYQDSSLEFGMWVGKAVDKQINSRVVQLSNYWIAEFLDSNFKTTPAAGTRRLAVTLRAAAKKSADVGVKTEIASAVTLARSLKGKKLSIKEFVEKFGLSDEARAMIFHEVPIPGVIEERFEFDLKEFKAQVAYRSVELNSGATLTAQSSEFDKVFSRENLDEAGNKVRFSTEGRVVGEKLGKAR